jgi:adenylate kinase family enzyme
VSSIVILIGGPSGAGKSSFARQVMERRVAPINDIIKEEFRVSRIDYKSLGRRNLSGDAIIIECTMQNFSTDSHQWKILQKHIADAACCVFITLKESRITITKRYTRRIYKYPADIPFMMRALQLSKYKSIIKYMFTQEIDRAYEKWRTFVDSRYSTERSDIRLTVKSSGSGYAVSPARD